MPVAVTVQRQDGITASRHDGLDSVEPIYRYAVESIGEVWQVDDEWWRQPVRRRYVEVMLVGGKHAVLYEDLPVGVWYVQTA
jgi:hypothetical protein